MKNFGSTLLAICVGFALLQSGGVVALAKAATLDNHRIYCDLHPRVKGCRPFNDAPSGVVVRDHRHEHPPKECTGDRKGPNGVVIHCN